MGEVTSTTNIAHHLGADKGNISRELADLLHIGKIVKGEKQGRAVPYHLVGRDESTPESSHAPASADGAPAAADS